MTKHIVLIHGTWCSGNVWGQFATELENLGYTVHTPSLRYHDLPYKEVEKKIGTVSLTDYVNDTVELIEKLDQPPIILGHSLGCLIAQLVAAKTPVKAMILLGPAPAAGIFAFYPTMILSFYKHFLRWGFWRKPMPPYKHAFYNYCMNVQKLEDKHAEFKKLVPESGLVYFQMALPFLDKTKAAKVDFEKIKCPVLIVTGTKDKMTVSQIAYATARKYKQATVEVIKGADHMYESGKYMKTTVKIIKEWTQGKLGI